MSILDFKASLQGGGARANQFRVDLNFPAIVSNVGDAKRKANFLCHSTTLPGSQLGVALASYRGRDVPLAGERTFTPWGISVYNDTDFAIRDAFESWMSRINDVKENTGITNPMLYTSQLVVTQLDRNNAALKTYTIYDAWPTNIGDIQLDFGNNAQIETFPVQFVYTYWTAETSTGAVTGGNLGI
jgi:hypothetical protein